MSGMKKALDKQERFERSIRTHGVAMGLNSLGAIGEHLGYVPQTFRKKMKTNYFTLPELMQLFRQLHYTDDEIVAVFK